jgi:enoyl-CoA hydratase/carnithine racemase
MDPVARRGAVHTGRGGATARGDRRRAHGRSQRDEGTTGIWYWIRTQFGGIARLITQSDKVFIAAINGDDIGDFPQIVVATDFAYAARRWRAWSEVFFSRFDVPNVGNLDTLAYYVEAQLEPVAQWFLSAR